VNSPTTHYSTIILSPTGHGNKANQPWAGTCVTASLSFLKLFIVTTMTSLNIPPNPFVGKGDLKAKEAYCLKLDPETVTSASNALHKK
jgi:hypothetical protein